MTVLLWCFEHHKLKECHLVPLYSEKADISTADISKAQQKNNPDGLIAPQV